VGTRKVLNGGIAQGAGDVITQGAGDAIAKGAQL
jgi:hypothetical protein